MFRPPRCGTRKGPRHGLQRRRPGGEPLTTSDPPCGVVRESEIRIRGRFPTPVETKEYADSGVSRFVRVIPNLGLHDIVYADGDEIADDGRFERIPVLQAVCIAFDVRTIRGAIPRVQTSFRHGRMLTGKSDS